MLLDFFLDGSWPESKWHLLTFGNWQPMAIPMLHHRPHPLLTVQRWWSWQRDTLNFMLCLFLMLGLSQLQPLRLQNHEILGLPWMPIFLVGISPLVAGDQLLPVLLSCWLTFPEMWLWPEPLDSMKFRRQQTMAQHRAMVHQQATARRGW